MRTSAIVPAYNEAERIEGVLRVLAAAPELDEIVVVDDGSKDGTTEVVQRLSPRVQLLRQETNIGKGQAMERGAAATKGEFLFFCDADIVGLTPAIVRRILQPVLHGEADMSIGIRENMMQRAVHEFALCSGERALSRATWEKIPAYFKEGFRIEIGLNTYVRQSGGKIAYEIYPYRQTLKEVKYGLIRGLAQRWLLHKDVAAATWYALTGR